MSIIAHIESLHKKHKELEVELHDAYMHHVSTEGLKELKRRKLAIKDEIIALQYSAKLKQAA